MGIIITIIIISSSTQQQQQLRYDVMLFLTYSVDSIVTRTDGNLDNARCMA